MLIQCLIVSAVLFVSSVSASNPVRLRLEGLVSNADSIQIGKVVEAELVDNDRGEYDLYVYTFDTYKSIDGDSRISRFKSTSRLKMGGEYFVFLKDDPVEALSRSLYAMEVTQSRLDLTMLWVETNTLWELSAGSMPVQVETIRKCDYIADAGCQIVLARELIPLSDVLELVGARRNVEVELTEWTERSMYGTIPE